LEVIIDISSEQNQVGSGVNPYAEMAQQRWQVGCIAPYHGQNKWTVQLLSVTVYGVFPCLDFKRPTISLIVLSHMQNIRRYVC